MTYALFFVISVMCIYHNALLYGMHNTEIDAVRYLTTMPGDVRKKIGEKWCIVNPIKITKVYYTPRKVTTRYPFALDERGAVTAYSEPYNKAMTFNASECTGRVTGVAVSGSDKSGRFCVIDNQLWDFYTGKRFVFKNELVTMTSARCIVDAQKPEYHDRTGLNVSALDTTIQGRIANLMYQPLLFSPDGSQCVVLAYAWNDDTHTLRADKVLLCAIQQFEHNYTNIDPVKRFNVDYAAMKIVEEICSYTKEQTTLMPSNDTVVVSDKVNGYVSTKKRGNAQQYLENIDEKFDDYSSDDIYCIDTMPETFLIDYRKESHVKEEEKPSRILCIHSVIPNVQPYDISVPEEWKDLPIMPQCSMLNILSVHSAVQEVLDVSPHTLEDLEAGLLLTAGYQLSQKSAWSDSDAYCARLIVNSMRALVAHYNNSDADVRNSSKNPYYLWWLAQKMTPQSSKNFLKIIFNAT